MPRLVGKHIENMSLEQPFDRVHARLLRIGVVYTLNYRRVPINKKRYVIPAHVKRHSSIRSRAAKRGLEFDLTPDLIRELIESPCYYCLDDTMPSQVDRKDSRGGYTRRNVVPACRRCNTIKNDTVSFEEMIFIACFLEWRKDA